MRGSVQSSLLSDPSTQDPKPKSHLHAQHPFRRLLCLKDNERVCLNRRIPRIFSSFILRRNEMRAHEKKRGPSDPMLLRDVPAPMARGFAYTRVTLCKLSSKRGTGSTTTYFTVPTPYSQASPATASFINYRTTTRPNKATIQ